MQLGLLGRISQRWISASAKRRLLCSTNTGGCDTHHHHERHADASAIRYPDGRLRQLSQAWLRFNCRCPDCHSNATHQRAVAPAAALASSRGLPRISYLAGPGGGQNGGVRIEWADGHASEFTFGQLDALLAPDESRRPRALWRGASSPIGEGGSGGGKACPVPVEDFVSSDSGYRMVLRDLWTYGVATVTGVEATEAATEAVVRRMAPVMETLFGSMWTFTSDGSREDSAYGNMAIGLHNDNTYLHSGAGLQVFHILKQSQSGGKTCLADGFHAIEILRQENRVHFDLLTHRPVFHHYLESGPTDTGLAHHTRCLDTVIKLNPEADGAPYQIRYNPYDLGSLSTLPQAEVAAYLEAYSHLDEIINRPKSHVWLTLLPGTVLFLDNWRVLHGRSGFSGERVVTGCYVTRDAWMSQARVHGVV